MYNCLSRFAYQRISFSMLYNLFIFQCAILPEKSETVAIMFADLHMVLVRVDQLGFARSVSDCRCVAVTIKSSAEVAHLRRLPLFLGGQIRDVNFRLTRNSLGC